MEEAAPTLSEQLKQGTSAAHRAAENVSFVKNFIKGEIPKPLYTRFLVDLYHVYTVLERRLEQESLALPRDQGGLVAPIWFPHELSECDPRHCSVLHCAPAYTTSWLTSPPHADRVESLEADLAHWLGPAWREAEELEVSPCTREYVQRLEATTAAGVVAHAYTRYMGDLSGGQILMRKAQKAFGMRGCTDGLSFYVFPNIAKEKVFKEQFRRELDGLHPDKQLADEIIAEANVAFLLNMRLFAELDVLAGVEGAELPPLFEAVDALIAAAHKEASEAAALRAQGLAPAPCECPFANLGKYLEKCDFKWLLRLHQSEGEGARFAADVAREKKKRQALALEQAAATEDRRDGGEQSLKEGGAVAKGDGGASAVGECPLRMLSTRLDGRLFTRGFFACFCVCVVSCYLVLWLLSGSGDDSSSGKSILRSMWYLGRSSDWQPRHSTSN
jgi:heme oxygenase|eukprot:COSAG01_NODE_6979_length_3406_cov_115.154218_1_plen_445_part_00